MGKTGKWWKSFLVGKKEDKEKKKEREKDKPASSTPSSKEKRRWSFRRSAGKELTSTEISVSAPLSGISEVEMDQKRHAMAVAIATAAAAQAAAAVMRLTATAKPTRRSIVEEAAAVKIQTSFRGYLARKALFALRGLVKLQALIRGHLVRKQASATLRCMQALVTAQQRARVQRIRMLEEAQATPQRQPNHRRSPQHPRNHPLQNMEKAAEENIKIVEIDLGESRSISKSRYSYSTPQTERTNHRFSTYVDNHRASCRLEGPQLVSPSPSALTDLSPRTCSALLEEFSFKTAQSSPHYLSSASLPEPRKSSFHLPRQAISYNDHPFFPNYMANTESSRAKARSQSAPKQRHDSSERPPSRRKSSIEGRNIPRSGRMQRSASHVGATAHMQYPWSLKLDRSSISLIDSECGSTSTVLTNNTHCKSIAAFEAYGYI